MVVGLKDPFDRPLTHRDLDHTPEDGNRYEVIDGALQVTPFPSSAHQRAMTSLTVALFNHVEAEGLGRVFAAGLKVVLDEPTGVGPDVVFISTARLGGLRDDAYYGAPDLVVEVLSTKPEFDQVVKRHKYAAAEIPHYWIIDPEERRISVLRLGVDGYRLVEDLGEDASFPPELFPGLTLLLSDLWM